MSGAKNDKPTVLVVDDTPESLTILNSVLATSYRVRVATSGERALQLALSEPKPDLVLLDIVMPGMDGYEVCSRIKADPSGTEIPVIFLTARTAPEDEVKGFGLGAVDYVTKPVNPNRLLARVGTHIELARARRRLAEQNAELIEAARLREDVERMSRHDLRSPLSAILGYPQCLLMDDNLTDEQREIVEDIETAGKRMLEMINLSLDLFKMERRSYQLTPEPVDLIGLARKVFDDLEPEARRKALKLELLLGDAPPPQEAKCDAWGESLLCYSMLGNLCKNAVEASPPGASVRVSLAPDIRVGIEIENEGGIPEEIRAKLFDKYVTAGKEKGTGLGTYSAKLMAETQNGAIALDTSTPGRVRMRVDLPAVPE